MAWIETPAETHYPWYVRAIYWLQRRKYGAELEPARVWGRMPRTFVALTLLYRTIDRPKSPIPAALRSLIIVRVSQINWCAFCVDLNSATALERLVTPEKLADLDRFSDSPRYTPPEKAALRYAEAITQPGGHADDSLKADLKTHFSDDAIVEITSIVAFQNLSSKFNAALEIPAQGFCRKDPANN